MTCAAFRDQTKCECLLDHLQGAEPSALSIIDPNRTPPKPLRTCLTPSPQKDRIQASASAQTELDIVTLGSAHRPPWLVAD